MGSWRVSARWREFALLWLIGLSVAFGSVNAGLWQLDRLDQRREFNANVQARIEQPVVDARSLSSATAPLDADYEWRRVSFTGAYDLTHQTLIRGRYNLGRYGYEVITPLVGSDGQALLVDRGWVPAGASATEVPLVPAPPLGAVEVTGRLRVQDRNLGPQGAIVGLPTRAANRIDPRALADELPYPTLDGYLELVRQIPSQESPEPVRAPELSEGPHLAYAIQWFFFALLGLAAPLIMMRSRAQDSQPTSAD